LCNYSNYVIIILVPGNIQQKSFSMANKKPSLPKAIALTAGVALMLPVATSWQSMFGSVHKAIGSSITVDSANAEKERMEAEMNKMMEQMQKLEDLIKNLEQE
jgi:hypothetical protein